MSKMWLSCIYLKILAALGQGISGKLALNLSGLCFIILQKNRNWSCLMWNGRDRWKWKQDKPDQCFSNSCFSKHRFLGPNLRYCLLEFFKTPFLTRRRQWHPTAVLLPGKSHGQRSLVGCSPWGWEELDTTEWLHFHFSLSCIGEGNGNPLQCSCLENPRDDRAWWAAVCGVTHSQTRLQRLSSSSIF